MINEENDYWKPVKNYENYYEINKDGLVKSLHKKNIHYILEQRIDRGGYYTVRLSKPVEKIKTFFVHRLLALSYIPNVEFKMEVNHINGNKLDNSLANLEFVTHSMNMIHAYSTKLIKRKTKQLIDNCTGEQFPSAKVASKVYGINYNTLRCYLNGGIKKNATCLQYAVA